MHFLLDNEANCSLQNMSEGLLRGVIQMKTVLFMAVFGLGFVFCSPQANAQYPAYGGGYGYGGYQVHHDHHYSVPAPIYQPGYSSGYESSYGSYGVGNALPPAYGGYTVPQYSAPATTSYFSNNYYGRPALPQHSWHPGHYLFGHY